jgi:isochorismate hydrolase
VVIVQSPQQQPPPPAAPPINEEDQQALALLADLQRYIADPNEDLKRELAAANQAVTRTRSDAARIRLAVLLTLPAAGPPDDARALSLLESVAGKNTGASPLKQIATILYGQISERTRRVSEEQRKTAAAQEKIDALRAVERSLLLERSRNAGGAGGGGGGGGTGR